MLICSITIGEIASSLIALVALFVAWLVAKSQIELNERLVLTDRFVQVNADVLGKVDTGKNGDDSYSELQIYNVGKSVIYLAEYIFDGQKNPNINKLLAPAGFGQYIINVPGIEKSPESNIPQHHIELVLSDDENTRHSCSIYIKYINGKWREEVTRCKKM